MSFYYSISPFIEIVIIAIMINYLLSFFWNTRSMDLVLGLLAFLLIFGASSLFDLPILHQLMLSMSNIAVLAIVIIFQPELRVALSKLSLKGKRYKEITEFDIISCEYPINEVENVNIYRPNEGRNNKEVSS